MRQSLLERDPGIHSVSMHTLVGIAGAIEHESVRRYAMLAQMMERRGEAASAAAFRVMLEEERGHVEAVERWAAGQGEPVPPPEQFQWQLPADLSSSWDDIAGSALLTPYRAFAIAVENEQRAFSFYTYLSAHADDARVMAEAEKLATEELRHAALMRRWRRQAYHRSRRAAPAKPPVLRTIEALHRFLAQHEAAIAALYRVLAARLRRAGDAESALLLEQLLESPSRPVPGPSGARANAGPDADADTSANASLDADAGAGVESAGKTGLIGNADAGTGAQAVAVADAAAAADDPAHLLIAAQKPLEALSESLDSVLGSAEGDLFAETEKAVTNVVARLTRVVLQAERRLQSKAP